MRGQSRKEGRDLWRGKEERGKHGTIKGTRQEWGQASSRGKRYRGEKAVRVGSQANGEECVKDLQRGKDTKKRKAGEVTAKRMAGSGARERGRSKIMLTEP